MRSIKDIASLLFLACLGVLTTIAVLGVWEVFAHDVIAKSFQTLGVIAFVSVIVIIASKFMDSSPSTMPSPMTVTFRGIRSLTLSLLILSASLLALIGILSIWDVIANADVLHKSLSSIAVVAFSSYIAVAVCLERENHALWQRRSAEVSIGGVVALGILFWIAVFAHLF